MRDFATVTHTGLIREHNEDSYEHYPDASTWLVADGVGGHARGEVASQIVCSVVGESLEAGVSLKDALLAAHRAILEEIDEQHAGDNMGSTAVAVQLEDDQYTLAWVGDSRVYRWNGKLSQLTRDHTHVENLVDQGVLTREQAAEHPQRHLITQSLGVSREMELDVSVETGTLAEHDQLLLCTDGLTDELSDAEIAFEMQRNSEPQGQVAALVGKALDAGGRDNVTVTVIGALSKRLDDDTTLELQPAARQVSGLMGYGRMLWAAIGLAAVIAAYLIWGG